MSTEYDRTTNHARTDEKHRGHQIIDGIDPAVPKTSGTVNETGTPRDTDATGYATPAATHTTGEPDLVDATGAEPEPVAAQHGPAAATDEDIVPLFDEQSLNRLRGRWRDLQGEFVDDPRDAVANADHLVTELIQELTSTYAERQKIIASRWSESPDTESMRRALRSYRAFFNQLLSPTS
ncbi:hypothetical protein ACFWUP_02885 [Nocardia sp. NPDC058658]|uniref:hypothetical protein n=1 Tax=Nocardia sp. NPDC058658 TaxID=3346580 RepID=UPI003659BB78